MSALAMSVFVLVLVLKNVVRLMPIYIKVQVNNNLEYKQI